MPPKKDTRGPSLPSSSTSRPNSPLAGGQQQVTRSKSIGAPPNSPALQKTDETNQVEITVTPDKPLPSISKLNRDLTKCPCGQSNPNSRKIDCSDCEQIWHVDCLSFKGLKQDSINSMLEYLCPYCYKSPVPTNTAICDDVDLCHTCRGTELLQRVNNDYEMVIASEHSKKLNEMMDKMNTLNDEINSKIAKLENITTQAPSSSITLGINGFAPFKPEDLSGCTIPLCEETPTSGYKTDFMDPNEAQEIEKFLDNARSNGLFKQKNGRLTAAYGTAYRWATIYNGDREKKDIPVELKPLLEKAREACGPAHPALNSVLINYFPAKKSASDPDSKMPQHSDHEDEINPESTIATFSLGATRTLTFSAIHSDDTSSLDVESNSLYLMTKASQSWYKHAMPDVEVTGARYSITMRHVEPTFSRSTVIVGDSNTQEIEFGEGRGTMGEKYPGKRIKAAHILNIDPRDCVGYANIAIVCGTNDLRPVEKPNIEDLSRKLREKVQQIRLLNPRSKIILMPVLPTREVLMNNNVVAFNRSVTAWFKQLNDPYISNPSVYDFLDRSGLLDRKLTRSAGETIHLGKLGLCKFVSLIKNSIYLKEKYLKSQQGNPSSRPRQSRSQKPD